jgi:hypothetical protein
MAQSPHPCRQAIKRQSKSQQLRRKLPQKKDLRGLKSNQNVVCMIALKLMYSRGIDPSHPGVGLANGSKDEHGIRVPLLTGIVK